MAHTDAAMADALKEYANTACSTAEIAERYGVSASTLTVWAKRANIPLRGRGRDRLKQPDARTREILALAEVVVQDEVARRFGITKQRVAKIVGRWRNWSRPEKTPFTPGDVVHWKGNLYTVLEGGPLFGRVQDEKGNVIHNFYWNMRGSIACLADAKMQAAIRKGKSRK